MNIDGVCDENDQYYYRKPEITCSKCRLWHRYDSGKIHCVWTGEIIDPENKEACGDYKPKLYFNKNV